MVCRVGQLVGDSSSLITEVRLVVVAVTLWVTGERQQHGVEGLDLGSTTETS